MGPVIVFLFGLIVGSFLNVCIHRIPRSESVLFPPSHCPRCSRRITWRDNIPVLSFLLLGGRCRVCREKISPRYPLVELLTAFFSIGIFLISSGPVEYLVYFIFTAALIVISFIDLQHRIVPNVISIPGIPLGFLASFFLPRITWVDSLLGILLGGGIIYLVIAVYYLFTRREGMGAGDLKLLAMIGAFLGWKGAAFSLVSGALAGSILGLALILVKGWTRRDQIPFGPFLSLGAAGFLLGGARLVDWYLSILRPV
ncbi:MAG: prepilin peptidase [bacterium]|nr:prepilin peptidase [bacterium]